MLDLFSHFRFHFAVMLTLLGAALILSAGRPRPTASMRSSSLGRGAAALSLVCALINCWQVIPHCWLGRPPPISNGKIIRLMLINVQSENRKAHQVLQRIREVDPDLIVLEEVNDFWSSALQELRSIYPFEINDLREDNFGIALLSKRTLFDPQILFLGEAEVPSVTAIVEISGRHVTILGTHPVPPGGSETTRLRNEQLAKVAPIGLG